ncbi:MAG: AraC family transcriptional regulator [Clostridia bacterium]|nr:AraC family transcriptional regulator [Clostridia bacterium]
MEFRYELNDSIQINLIGRCDGIPGTYAGRHTHPFWELVLMMEGEGKQLSCDEVLEVGKDSLWLIPPGVVHDFYNENSPKIEKLYLGFTFQCSPKQREDISCYDLTGYAQARQIIRQLRETANQLEKQACFSDVYSLIGLLAQIVALLFPKNNEWDYQISSQDNLVNHIKVFLHDNVCRSVKTSELSAMFYLSPHYMGDVFKKNTGFSVKEYHNMLRMEHSLRLLKESDLSVTKIAEQMGFDSLHYFSKKFKEYYHQSPNSMRKRIRQS